MKMIVCILSLITSLFGDVIEKKSILADQEMLIRNGTLPITTETQIGFTAYHREQNNRPITFVFNGGPGYSSFWLHLGGIGPRSLSLENNTTLEDNPYSYLDFTDLIFIDPVDTGLSTAENPSHFFDIQEDGKAFALFIEKYLTTYPEYWLCDKYLLGESYGATRAIICASVLEQSLFISLKGMIFFSPAIDYTAIFNRSTFLPYILSFPSYAATSAYHLGQNPKKAFISALTCCETELLPLFFRKNRLTQEEEKKLVSLISTHLQVSESFVYDCEFYPSLQQLSSSLLGDHLTLGRMDSRFTGPAENDDMLSYQKDPSLHYYHNPLCVAFKHYLAKELEMPVDQIYKIRSSTARRQWSFSLSQGLSPELLPILSYTMLSNPELSLFVAGGYFDLATPYYSTLYTFDQLPKSKLYQRIDLHCYMSGHMPYLDRETKKELFFDVKKFYTPLSSTH